MNSYVIRPKRKSTARLLWDALVKAGFTIHELHYNSNCWGASQLNGWGTWAFSRTGGDDGFFCGIKDGRIWIQGLSAPYAMLWVDELTPEKIKTLGMNRHF